jgi:hypothetical protein
LWRRDGYFAWNWYFFRISPQTRGIDESGKREFLREDQGVESLASLGEPMGGDRYWRYDLGKHYGEIKYPLR